MLVEGPREPSAGPPTGLGGLNACSVSCAKTTTCSNPLLEPPRPEDPCASAFVAGTPNGAPAGPEPHKKWPTQGAEHLFAAVCNARRADALYSLAARRRRDRRRPGGGETMRLLTSGLYVTNLVSAVLCERPVARWSRKGLRGVKPRRQVRSWALRTDGEVRGDVLVRRARNDDIPRIQRCNRASLPENYNDGFYARHIADWGHLAYVAECVDDADDLAGYVLGRVNERGSELPAPVTAASRTRPVDGHVTSLAVHAKHRRRGVARALMRQVHKNMALEVDCAKLHVRCSNAQALQLYAGLGYDVVDVVQSYYHDGEAAYLMQADVKKLAAADAAEDSASEEAVLAA